MSTKAPNVHRRRVSASQTARDQRRRAQRRQREEQTFDRLVALRIIAIWGAPRTASNIEAVSELVKGPAEAIQRIADRAPRSWILAGIPPAPRSGPAPVSIAA